jgi:Zn finger protein HypA/HybF involved in hydrogenase expression
MPAEIIRAGVKARSRCECCEKNLQLSTLERVCESLDVPMWEVIRDAERGGVAGASGF